MKKLVKEKYEKVLQPAWNSQAFVDSLRIVWNEIPENDQLLRKAPVDFAGTKAGELMGRADFVALWKESAEMGLAVFNAFIAIAPKHPQPHRGCTNSNIDTVALGTGAWCGFCAQHFVKQ